VLQRSNDVAVVQAFTQHLTDAALLPEGSPGVLQSFYDVSSPISGTAITAYRAWLHLYLVWLAPLGFGFSTPDVNQTSCDILWRFPGEHVWYRGELKSWSDMRLNANPANQRNSFISKLRPSAGRYNSSAFHFILVMHAVPPDGHPQDVVLPANLQRIFAIPMSALLANCAIDMRQDWKDPQTGLVGVVPARGIADAGWTAPGPRCPSLNVSTDYYTRAFPARSNNPLGDWALEFMVSLQPETLVAHMAHMVKNR
jgi:hypothetical protein